MSANPTQSVFVGRGVSFTQIVISGELGGRNALKSFLRIRVSQSTRDLSRGAADPQTSKRRLHTIAAFNEGIRLIETSASSGNKILQRTAK